MNGGTAPHGGDGQNPAAVWAGPLRRRVVGPPMRRRTVLASVGPLLAGCLGGPSATDEPGVATSTGGGIPRAPLVNWAFDLDRAEEVATVTHDTGERLTGERTDRIELVLTTAPDHPVPADATLTPTRTPQVIRRTWRESGGAYPIRPGDAVRFASATPGDTLEVWWFGTAFHREGVRLEAATFSRV